MKSEIPSASVSTLCEFDNKTHSTASGKKSLSLSNVAEQQLPLLDASTDSEGEAHAK
jgi:hypothetical protein